MNEPITQAQDHDRRIGRLEGIIEQVNSRLESIEKRLESLNNRIFWVIGIQLTTFVALGALILSRLP